MADTERRRVQLTLFTLADANQVAREISPELGALVEMRRELERVGRAIQVLELAAAGASEENPDARDLEREMGRRSMLQRRLRDGIERIHRRGCVVKDLDRGLIDFYSLDGDRLIFLCWQLGERRVSHWHTLDGGFANRIPVPDGGSDLE